MSTTKVSGTTKNDLIILLVYGYTREIKLTLNNIYTFYIPSELNELIILYHPREYLILSIGRNLFGEFGLNNESENNNKYEKLYKFSSLCYNHNEIYCGFFTFTVRTQDNIFYSCGNNCDGQLGVNCRDYNIKQFKQISTENECNINIFSNGPFSWHRIFVTTNNKFYGFGRNKNNTFGATLIETEKNYKPIPLYNLTSFFSEKLNYKIISIECGASHTLFLCDNGKLFSCGENDHGQCGLENNDNSDNSEIIKQPTEIKNIPKIIKISVGEYFSLSISYKYDLWVFGSNKDYQLGMKLGYEDDQEGDDEDDEDEDDEDEDKDNVDIFIPKLNEFFYNKNIKISSIYCGESHSFIICGDELNSGNVYCFGQNQHGESLGKFRKNDKKKYEPICFQSVINDKNVNIKTGSCGNTHTMLLTKYTNKIYGFGANDHGQVSNYYKDTKIHKPILLTKKQIGIHENSHIERVIAGCYTTIIVCDHL